LSQHVRRDDPHFGHSFLSVSFVFSVFMASTIAGKRGVNHVYQLTLLDFNWYTRARDAMQAPSIKNQRETYFFL